jgi:hypothetical protein
VAKIFQAQGRKPCEHCGKFGHAPQACWSLPQNAHMRPIFPRGQVLAQQGQNVVNGNNRYMPPPNVPRYVGTWNQPVMNQRMATCLSTMKTKNTSFLFAVGPMNNDDLQSINDSLKGMGLTLNDLNVWIGDTGATTHNTAYICNSVNHCEATKYDNIVAIYLNSQPRTA